MTHSADHLMRLHVEALFTHDEDGRLLAVNEPDGGAAPKFFLGRTPSGNVWRFRHDVSEHMIAELDALCRAEPTRVPEGGGGTDEAFRRTLERHSPVQRAWGGPTYHFPPELQEDEDTVLVREADDPRLRPHFEEWLGDPPGCQPFLALLRDDVAVSVCASVRTTVDAHEAGVETPEELRGRGYAGRVAVAWARAVEEGGAVPLYSTSWENTASQAVAKKLGLVRFGATLHFS